MGIEGFELSPQQARLWALAAQLSDRDVDAVARPWPSRLWTHAILTVPAEVDRERIEAALGQVVARHEILRTVFRSAAGMRTAVQVVLPAATPSVELAAGPPVPMAELVARARRPADIGRAPALRCQLGETADRGRVLVLSVPGLCADQLAMEQLVTELAAACQRVAGPSEGQVLQYADYAQWQCDVDGAAGPDAFPGDRRATPGSWVPAPAVAAPAGGGSPEQGADRHRFVLSEAHRAGAAAAAADLGVDLPEALLACWRALLWVLSVEPGDLTCWNAVAGRDEAELAGALGLFERRLPVTAPVGGGHRLADVARATATAVAGLADLRRLVAPIPPPPAGAVGFRWVAAAGSCAPFTLVDSCGGTDALALDLTVRDVGGQLQCAVESGTGQLRGTVLAELAERFCSVVRAFGAHPHERVGALDVCTGAERAVVTGHSRPRPAAPVTGRSGYELVAEQAARRPAAPALIWRDRPVSYAELAGQVDRLSGGLRAAGVGRGSRVGIYHRSGPELVASVLAIWRLGGCYVPVNPTDPPGRAVEILGRAGCRQVLVDDPDRERALLAGDCPAVPLRPATISGVGEVGGPAVAGERGPEVVDRGGDSIPAGIAHLAHTSGSTGAPNLLSASHHGILHYFAYLTGTFRLDGSDVVLQVAPFGFDAWLRDTIAPLTVGASVVLVDDERRRDPAGLVAEITRHGITRLLHCVPSQLRELTRAEVPVGETGTLRTVLSSGEPMYYGDAEAVWAKFGRQVEVVNQYGPTECTLTSTYHRVEPPVAESGGTAVPLGEPVGDTRIYLLNDGLRPVPRGVVGEICIGGPGVSYGYEGQPGLTAERFVPDPFSPGRGGRLYRTGDLARHSAAGELEFVGRGDDQLKLRGVRVELGEVAATLTRHPGVTDAAVVAARADDQQPEPQLVAFVVPAEPATPATQLRRWLAERLPEPLVPTLLVDRGALPTTRHGKRDRRRLAAEAVAELRGLGAAAGYVAPRTDGQRQIVEVFARMLNRERVGIHDSFFHLGGNSLLGTRAAYQISNALGVSLPLRAIFERPTAEELAALAETLPRAEARPATQPGEPAAPAPAGDRAPLLPIQQEIWAAEKVGAFGSAYNVPCHMRIIGSLDPERLRSALQRVLDDHETLRLRIGETDGEPHQTVAATAAVELPQRDLRGLSPGAQEEELRRLAADLARQPFALDAGLLWRVLLARTGPAEHALLMVVHHLAADLRSLGLLRRRIWCAYRNRAEPDAAVSYLGEAAAARARSDVGEAASYWRGVLAGYIELLALPTSRPRRAGSRRPLGEVPITLDPRHVAGLARLASRHGSTMHSVLLAVWVAVLHRVTGSRDLVVAVPSDTRARTALDKVGMFVTQLPIRVTLRGAVTVQETLARVHRAMVDGLSHQEAGNVVRLGGSAAALTQVSFAWKEWADGDHPAAAAGLRVTLLDLGHAHTKADLTLRLGRHPGSTDVRGLLEYDADIFDAGTAEHLARCVVRAAELFAVDAARPLRRIELLDPAERDAVLAAGHGPLPPGPAPDAVTRFRDASDRFADRDAVEAPDGRLTFRELRQRAAGVGGALRSAGIGPQDRVAIAIDNSSRFLPVAVLGALSAHAAYVPLDLRAPRAGQEQVVALSGARAVLTHGSWEGSAECPVPVIDVGDLPPARHPGSWPAPAPDSACYVLFTSGSSGGPKGVVVSHRNLACQLAAMEGALDLLPGDRYAMVQPLSVDSSVSAFWPPLISGGTLVLVPWLHATDPARMRELFRDGAIQCLKIAPSHLQALPDEVRPTRWLVVGGEPADFAELSRIAKEHPGCRVVHGYGPTETTVNVTYHTVTADAVSPWQVAHIGQAMTGVRIQVVDERGDVLPFHCAGQIAVSGDLVSRGYLDRPGLTGGSFTPDPYGPPGSRRYLTGDLGCLSPDGSVRFLGRRDGQLKVRGFRIEAGEVEAVLRRHPGVSLVAVDVREIPGQGPALVTYVAGDRTRWTPESLRELALSRLPAQAVPSVVVPVAEMPRLSHGKVDRRALPDPPATVSDGPPAGDGPLADLAAIWREVLNVGAVDPDHDFFVLGGHSLTAMQVLTRIRTRCGVELSMADFFSGPTLRALAGRVERLAGRAPRAPARRDRPDGELELTAPQRRLWFLEQLYPGQAQYNVAVAVAGEGAIDAAALTRAVHELASRHPSLRTLVDLVDGRPRPRVADLEALVVTVARHRSYEEASEAAQRDADFRFDLATDPPLRTHLYCHEPHGFILLFNLHHLVFDRWSRERFAHELSVLYRRVVAGGGPGLEPLRADYFEFADWQNRWLESPAAAGSLAWWVSTLTPLPAPVDLACYRPRPDHRSHRGDVVRFILDHRVRAEVEQLARRARVTPFMVIFSAFQVLLRQWGAAEDFVVGVPTANRPEVRFEGLIGMFVNTLPVRSDLAQATTFDHLLSRVRQRLLTCYQHQNIPFDLIVQEVAPPRVSNRDPLFDVLIAFQNVPRNRGFELPGTRLRPFPLDDWPAKRDLTLRIDERDDRYDAHLEFDRDIVGRKDAERLAESVAPVLDRLLAAPDRSWREGGNVTDRGSRASKGRAAFQDAIGRAAPKVAVVPVRSSRLAQGGPLTVLEAASPSVELVQWMSGQADQVDAYLRETGGLLFRGFGLGADPARSFRDFAAAVIDGLMDYAEQSSPRTRTRTPQVYTSTEYPASEHIELHHEMAYASQFPERIAFLCVEPATVGGTTPVADSRDVYDAMPPEIRDSFTRLGVQYVRNFGAGVDIPWQTAFGSDDPSEVERYCAGHGIGCEWLDGGRLRTTQVHPGTLVDRVSGRRTWFNSAHMFHLAAHEPSVRDSLRQEFGEAGVPRHARFGDGSPIPDDMIEEIRGVLRRHRTRSAWRQHDVMLLDNRVVCHGREPFEGPRRVLVAFGQPGSWGAE